MNDKCQMTGEKPQIGRAFDLEERTARFGEAVITFARSIPLTPVTTPLTGQIVRSGTSVGANYCEADDAISKKEFRKNICTCRKEARETKHWCRMIAAAVPDNQKLTEEARALWREAKELHLIFSKIFHSCAE
jgi:four helix bundle protein